jgi:hypothetical protein
MKIENFGDVTVSSHPSSGPHLDMIHRTDIVGEYILIQREGVTGRYAIMGSPAGNVNGMEFGLVDNGTQRFLAKTDGTVFASGQISGASFSTGGNITASGAVYASNWFRSYGVSGWYNETYGGGIYMADTTWVRTYGSKNLYVDAQIRVDGGANIQQSGVDQGAIYIQQGIGIDSNQVEASGALFLNALGGGVRVNGLGTDNYGLTVNGNAAKSSGGTAWATFSDLNLKKDITEYEKGLNEILQLRPVYFKYNGKAGTVLDEDNVGLIAQEVQTIFPKAVEEFQYCTETKPAEDTPVEKYLSFSFNEVQYALINAIKELSLKVDELESRLV